MDVIDDERGPESWAQALAPLVGTPWQWQLVAEKGTSGAAANLRHRINSGSFDPEGPGHMRAKTSGSRVWARYEDPTTGPDDLEMEKARARQRVDALKIELREAERELAQLEELDD